VQPLRPAIAADGSNTTDVLVEMAANGQRHAFEQLVETRLERTFRTACAILGNEADARDATQEAFIAAWIQLMGEKAAWEFMDKLHDNIAVYTHSGSAPCVQAAKGERMAGIGFDMRGAREKTQGAPIDIVLPKEGAGWDLEATGIVKGTKHLDLAKKVADWGASKGASELYSKYYALVAEPSVKNIPPNYPPNAEQAMVKNDFNWMAENRDRILAEWSKRYESKAAPK